MTKLFPLLSSVIALVAALTPAIYTFYALA